MTPGETPIASGKNPRFVATSFLALLSIVGLVLYGLPNYYDFFVKELGWTRAQVTSGNMLGKAVIGPLFGFLAGWLIDRVGPRRPMVVGLLLAMAAVMGLSGVTALPFFYLFYAMNALGYVLAGPLPNQVLLSRTFKAARGKAMGIAYLGIGVGGFVVPQIIKVLNAQFGWRQGLFYLSILVVVFAMPLVLLLREGDGPAPVQAGAPPISLKGTLGNRNFYLLALGSMASVGAVGAGIQHLKLMLALDHGWTQSATLNLASLVLGVSLVGRLGAGWLADKIGPKRVMLIVYGLVTLSMLILVAGASGSGIYLYALCFGLGLGGEYLIIPLMAAELYGTAVLGRVMGIILTADGLAEALFPWLVGLMRDSSGSYSSGFQMLAVLAGLGAMAVALLPGKRPATTPAVTTSPA
jgi:MFS family permease